MEENVRYPIGEQDFSKIRKEGLLYIDKTQYVERLIRSGSMYYFLARPRRFGKSLFLSTLRYFFEGRRELFKGLNIDSAGWDWQPYPVLYLDLNRERYAEPGKLDDVLNKSFRDWEEEYGIIRKDDNPSQRFETIIQTAHKKTGRQVVILVDEYDKPLVGNLNNKDNYDDYRSRLTALYSNFKSCAPHIRLVFLTGVSRFSRLSVFSDLNNLNDITFDDDFADICGITSNELETRCKEGISKIAAYYNISYHQAIANMKKNYDGYRFAERGSDIYNPWSVLNALDKSKIDYFWNETGLPTLIVESLKRINTNLEDFFNTECTEKDLKGLDLLNPNPVSLMYQTGYLTIKNYDHESRSYQLGIPNNEVMDGLFNLLVPLYVKTKDYSGNSPVEDIKRSFIFGKPEKAMKELQAFFAGIDYSMKMENENNFHNAFYLLVHLLGLNTSTEVHTSEGRIDIEIKTLKYIYIIELKYDHSAEEALKQIRENHYARKYQTDNRRLFEIGVEFSSRTRCIENWIISEYY